MKELKKYLPFDFDEAYSLKNSESWRWNRLEALYVPRSKLEIASLQSSAPDDFIEDFPYPDFPAFNEINNAPMAQLNLGLAPNFFYSFINENKVREEPVVIHLDGLGSNLQLCKILAGLKQNAKAQVWLDLSAQKNVWQNLLLQVELWENSHLDLVIWLGEADNSQTAQTVFVRCLQSKHSSLNVNAVLKNSSFARLDLLSELNGENCSFNFGGIQKATNKANVDFHIEARHKAENCQSRQVIRGILEDEALGIYNGLIFVKETAPNTVSNQDARFLLLSENSQAQAMPQLEIYNDEVKCNHGATVGKLDPESLFYLQSRGIDKKEAEEILINAFNCEAVVVEGEIEKMLKEAVSN